VKIAYVGNFSGGPHTTENHLAWTLEDMGHEVIRWQENAYDPTLLDDLIEKTEFDLFLFTRTWGHTVKLHHLDQLRAKGTPSASYHLDLYVGLQRESGLASDAFWRTDFVFTPDGSPEADEVFFRQNIKHHYIKPGVYKAECQPGNFRSELAQDVVFVGGGATYMHPEWPYRRELIAWLGQTYGARFGKYGHPEPTMRNQDLNDLYASAKVVVGDSLCLGFTRPYYWSDRVYETIGRGGFIIHPRIAGMEEEFIDGENIVFYEFNDWTGLKQKIDYYLEHGEARERVRKAGQEFVREHATYHDRLSQALQIIFPLKDVVPAMEGGIKINLGSGTDPAEGFINVDHLALPEVDLVHNLMNFPYPFEGESALEIRAIDVLEHLASYAADNRPSVIAFMEECHRILKPGGRLFIQTPRYDAEFLWIDPTHVRGFHPESFNFFDPETHYGKTTGFYSQAKFKVSVTELPNKNLQVEFIKR
jgi:SAM-dependent methyltransferase